MAADQTQNELRKVIEVFWRRKYVIVVPFLAVFILVSLWGLYQPNVYRSTTSIFIEPQKVPMEYVRSTVTSDIEGRLRTITQQLTSRTKLLAVITELDLYPEARAQGLPAEVLVERMRGDLTIEIPPTGRGGEANFFQVNFQHGDPTKAMLGVSRLVSLFIEESLQVRESQAEGTTKFIEEELQKLKTILEQQEQAIQEYKGRHMGELPDQLDANLRMLDNLQLQLANNQESKREMENRILVLEQEVSRLEGQMKVSGPLSAAGGTQAMTNTTLNQLLEQRELLAQRIASLATMYTDRHPDLLAARREMVRLEETIRSASSTMASSPSSPPASPQHPSTSMEMANLRRQLNDTKPRLPALVEEEANLRRQIAEYQRRVESAPNREQNLLKLTRDYENTKASYDDLLNKRQGAQLSENLEKRQQGEKFQILDPANFPEKPYLPNRPRILGMGFAGGLGAGVGLAVLLEVLFPAFYSLKQLQTVTSVPLTLGIPYIESARESRRRKRRTALVATAAIGVLLLLLAVVHFFVMDLIVLSGTIATNLKGMI